MQPAFASINQHGIHQGPVTISPDQLAQAGFRITSDRRLEGLPTAAGSPVRQLALRFAAAEERQDTGAVVTSFVDISRMVHRRVGLHALVPEYKGTHVTLKGLPGALHGAGHLVIHCSALRDMDLGLEGPVLQGRADHVAHCAMVLEVHKTGVERITNFVAPLAVQGAEWARTVYGVSGPILRADDNLARAAAPLVLYFQEPVERAQHSKDLTDKARQETAQKVTEQTEHKAREQAEKEVVTRVQDALKSALSVGAADVK